MAAAFLTALFVTVLVVEITRLNQLTYGAHHDDASVYSTGSSSEAGERNTEPTSTGTAEGAAPAQSAAPTEPSEGVAPTEPTDQSATPSAEGAATDQSAGSPQPQSHPERVAPPI